jgi:hypothetical protein
MVNAMPRFCRFARLCRRCFYRVLLCLAVIGAVNAAVGRTFGQPAAGADNNFERCRAIADGAARLRCYEAATAKPAPGLPLPTPGPSLTTGPWRLVRTPNPAGGPDAVSVMKTADVTKSDIDLAGLMLRCGKSNFDVRLVLVRPLPPRARPKVTATASGRTADLIGSVVPPGAEVLLPQEATALASGPWQIAPDLSVEVGPVEGDDPPTPIRGVIALAGLGAALAQLQANCPAP